MILSRLYIENFMCHEYSYIDFSEFSSALIVGKVENNDLYSNGVGKTTIFKAIEYCLFNQADVNLEKIIRDDAAYCKVTIDFLSDSKEYRAIRTRTKKGNTDISLFERNTVPSKDNETYHKINDKGYENIYCSITDEKYWKDVSGRRAADTEKDLSKILKINFKSFRSTVHFMQNDFSGLTTSTPEKRKGILKEALNLAIYSKLEKIAKEKSNAILKEIHANEVLIENINNPESDLEVLKKNLENLEKDIDLKSDNLKSLNNNLNEIVNNVKNLLLKHSQLESKFSELVINDKRLQQEKSKIEISVKEYTTKKSNIIKLANDIINEIKFKKDNLSKLKDIDFSEIESLTNLISLNKEDILKNKIMLQASSSKIEELNIPFPEDASCKHCRQPLSEVHKNNCIKQINDELQENEKIIKECKKKISQISLDSEESNKKIVKLNDLKKEFEKLQDSICNKEKELSDKKQLHEEYAGLLSKFQNELKNKIEEIEKNEEQLKKSSLDEANDLKNIIEKENKNIETLKNKIENLSEELSNLNSSKAVILHNIDLKNKDIKRKIELQKNLKELNEKYSIYPSVIQSFSSIGIPNLIIQNVLDDLQVEANNLLNKLKPSLQLSFFIEKTKSDGTESDTLDINYFLNGKERQYDQLSGAQKLAVTFSLKLGLSFLLQKMIGTDIRFLLLDEIDQSLDKASVDAFSDIVKFFQKDFTILIITHNDRLKDKFSHTISVEQDINMISRARVISSN